jgi:hypothetical protein
MISKTANQLFANSFSITNVRVSLNAKQGLGITPKLATYNYIPNVL